MNAGVSGLSPTVRYVHTADHQRLAVTELVGPGSARGTPVLLVHGFAQNRLSFELGPLPACLNRLGARVFLGELRGHGLSRATMPEPDRRDWGLETHLQYDLPALVKHVLRETGQPTLHYMGHSMGGILGYAALASNPAFVSMTGFAAPIWLGAGRPVVRLAAGAVAPTLIIGRPAKVHMDKVLGLLSSTLAAPKGRLATRMFQRFVGLSNPAQAAPEDLQAILGGADPESSKVFLQLANLSHSRRPKVGGIDLVAAIEGWSGPIAAVVGAHDIFAGPKSVQPLQRGRHSGKRTVITISQGAHVDVTMGYHVPQTTDSLWRFIES